MIHGGGVWGISDIAMSVSRAGHDIHIIIQERRREIHSNAVIAGKRDRAIHHRHDRAGILTTGLTPTSITATGTIRGAI